MKIVVAGLAVAAGLFLACRCACADTVELIGGGGAVSGKIIKETETHITVKLKTGGVANFPKEWVKSIKKEDIPDEELYTKQDIYRQKLAAADIKSADANLELAEWCLKNSTKDNGLLNLAENHLKIAKQIDPDISKKASRELIDLENRKAGELYAFADDAYNKYNDIIGAERRIFDVLSAYPQSGAADRAKGLLIKIWGSAIAGRMLNGNDGLPQVAFSAEELKTVLSHITDQDARDKYFAKCLNKCKDYIERAGEVDKQKKGGYYRPAIDCYSALKESGKTEVINIAAAGEQETIKKYLGLNPEPDSDLAFSIISNFLLKLKDPDFAEKTAASYLKTADDIYKKARKLKQPEKGEKAKTAYFCYSLVNNFSKDGRIRQDAFAKMADCQRLERAVK